MTAELSMGKSTRVRAQLIGFVSVLFVVMTYTTGVAASVGKTTVALRAPSLSPTEVIPLRP